ncbi:MAG: T9SS type A sorting domain-containing protein [Prevotella sp.]|nr:T9SS type A sorting domain-containing protein [Prevotella sp.]
MKVIGKKAGGEEREIYAFCPGQIASQYRSYGSSNLTDSEDENVWQQFYFEFFLDELCLSYDLRIENNCKSTAGGDYFLDDVWVFAQLPKVGPEMETPLCGGNLNVIQLETNFEPLLQTTGYAEATTATEAQTGYLSFIYLDWDNFLIKFQEGLASIGETTSGDLMIERINNGYYADNSRYKAIYETAFESSILREGNDNHVIYGNYQWSTHFDSNPVFSFADMALDTHNTVYGTTVDEQRRLVFNGSMGIAQWEFYHNYALLTTVGQTPIDADDALDSELLFNVLNACSNRALLWFVPKMEILGTIGGISIDKLVFCEFTTQTFAMELAGYTKTDDYIDENGNHQAGEYVTLSDVYFDWWMGIPKTDYLQPTDPNYNPGVPGTVENYLQQSKVIDGETIRLYDAVKAFRFTNPHATSLYDPDIKYGINPLYAGSGQVQPFTEKMLQYMRELANPSDGSRPQLYIHTKIVDIKIDESTIVDEIYLGDTIKYVKFVAIPIETNINEAAKNYVYICAEPQPFKLRVGAHAPHMQIGFGDKHYPAGLGTLSVRVSKSQFEKMVKRGDANPGMLHIPLRDIQVVTPECIGVKAPSDETDPLREVLVTNSTDALMQQRIMNWLENGHSLPPAVGYVDHLHGRDTQYWSEGHPETERLLKLHFNSDFQVREGYSYTLRYRFIEELGDGSDFPVACEGTGDFIIKIVPDYEVWTGGADNTDWSNDENWRRADYDELYAGNGVNLKNRYLPNGSGTQPYTQTNYVTEADRSRRQGFAPLYCTNILMMTSENIGEVETESVNPTSTTTTYKVKPASLLYDDGDEKVNGVLTGFPALRPTASPLIRYDFQAHEWVADSVSAHQGWKHRALGDMVTELYNDNVCDSIAFQSETELVNAHLLNYNKAWVEFALPKNKWHLVSSPLQNTISGEWYAPTWSGRQETTYYEPITFDGKPVTSITSVSGTYNLDYDRFAPAVYQRQWDKAKAVLYERGAVWSPEDASQTKYLGYGEEGDWTGSGQGYTWEHQNADDYLNRLVYKPFGVSKVNVAVIGSWSGAHNDHTVPYDNGGFSVMPINNLKSFNDEKIKTIFRLPKDDQYYDIWDWTKGYGIERRVRVYIKDGRAWPDNLAQSVADAIKDQNVNANDYMPNDTNFVELNNRGRLRSDFFVTPVAGSVSTTNPTGTLPEYYEVTLKNEGQGSLGYFLASNPFICGLDMVKFFALNSDVVKPYYLVMKDSEIDPKNPDLNPEGSSWRWTDMSFAAYGTGNGANLQGNNIVPPRYGFFLKSQSDDASTITLKYTTDMMVHTPRTVPESTTTGGNSGGGSRLWMTISAQRDGNQSEATVIRSANASNKFLPEEDLETFVVSDISSNIPVIYTLTGRLATSINRIHDFMVLPIGIESNSDEPATVTFQGVEMLGDSLMLYDAKTGEAVPLHSGFTTRMPGRTQNRFFIVQGSSLKEALAESNLQIFGEDGIIIVTSTTGQPITDVRVYDAGGRQVYVAAPGRNEHRFRLSKGIYVVKANTEDARQVKKISN